MGTVAAGVTATSLGLTTAGEAQAARDDALVDVVLEVNGDKSALRLDPRVTLLDALRERLAVTGPKKGCDRGQCGACTVHVGGRPVLACLTLAAAVAHEVTTVEGVARDGVLHPVQQAFIDQDAFQCGFCTSGQIMSAIACARDRGVRSDDEIREFMSGNICRCGAYSNITAAVKQAKGGGG
ncbi:(2Fe-2S)-binding protein [Sphaerisporangium aureirubrum]|uniref:(2Fe-2S)-binding protein n=1 Tax=Sphaerisporangium aureirubrum TaxID=1544736 RepID=A0ABW1NL83_9ACTN